MKNKSFGKNVKKSDNSLISFIRVEMFEWTKPSLKKDWITPEEDEAWEAQS